MNITSKHEMNIQARKLQERLEYVEERASQDKKEFQQQRDSLEKTILELESSRNEAIKNGKLDQERLNHLTEDSAKLEHKLTAAHKARENDLLT